MNHGQYLVRDPDSLFFLRLYDQSLLRGETIAVDEYGGYPHKRELKYPPFHMQFLLGVSLLAITIFPGIAWTVGMLIGWLPPFMGWLIAMLMVVFAWRQTKNRALTLLLVFAAIPGGCAALNSLFLKVDYTFLSHFLIWTWVLSSWMFVESKKNIWVVIGAVLAFAFTMTWAGVSLFFAVVSAYAIFLILQEARIAPAFSRFCCFSMLGASLPAFVYLFFISEASQGVGEFGFFQPVSLLIAALAIRVIVLIKTKSSVLKISRAKFLMLLLLALFVSLAALNLILPRQLSDGIRFLTISDPLMKSIGELKPGLDFSRVIVEPFTFFKGLFYLSILLFLFPFFYQANPAGIFSGGGRIIRDLSLIFVFLGIFAVRYYAWIGTVAGFWVGIMLYILFTYSLRLAEKHRMRFSVLRLSAGVIPFFLPFAFLHFIVSYPVFFQSRKINRETAVALQWIKSSTPVTSGYYDSGRPEYAFYCFWDKGNLINYYAQRPTLVNNTTHGFKKMAEIFAAESEQEALSFCDKYGVKYLFLDSQREFSHEMVRFIRATKKRDMPEDEYRIFAQYVDVDSGVVEYPRTFHYWMSNNLGLIPSQGFDRPASEFRLVFCSGYNSQLTLPRIMVFERVKGAWLKGKTSPGEKVVLSLKCRFQKIAALFKLETIADQEGGFAFKLPYSTGYKSGNVETEAEVIIDLGQDKQKMIAVSEHDIRSGKTIDLHL